MCQVLARLLHTRPLPFFGMAFISKMGMMKDPRPKVVRSQFQGCKANTGGKNLNLGPSDPKDRNLHFLPYGQDLGNEGGGSGSCFELGHCCIPSSITFQASLQRSDVPSSVQVTRDVME